MNKNGNYKHGQRYTRLYKIWCCMKERCYAKNNNRYNLYGGRGIKVCEEWKNDFILFYNWAINNGYKEDLTIDRIDINRNYEPSNCRWATYKQQARNKSNTRKVVYNGKEYPLGELSDLLKYKYKSLWCKLKRNNWNTDILKELPNETTADSNN